MHTRMHLCVFLSSFCKLTIFSFYSSSNHLCFYRTIGFERGQVSESLGPLYSKCVYVLMYACIFVANKGIWVWISNYFHYEIFGEITYPFPNVNAATVEVWEWISNFILAYGDLISWPLEFLVTVLFNLTYMRPACYVYVLRVKITFQWKLSKMVEINPKTDKNIRFWKSNRKLTKFCYLYLYFVRKRPNFVMLFIQPLLRKHKLFPSRNPLFRLHTVLKNTNDACTYLLNVTCTYLLWDRPLISYKQAQSNTVYGRTITLNWSFLIPITFNRCIQ